MNAQKKTTILLSVIFFIIFLVMIINISFNFRNYGIKSVEDKALVVSELIKHSLTSHMVNGTIDKRKFFLDQIKDSSHIKKLWLVRSPSLVKQYGEGFQNENAKDSIDKEVIATGKAKKIVSEDLFFNNTFRMTIPYQATVDDEINCLKCHDAKVGDTLGAISIVIDINDIKSIGMRTVLDIALVAFAVLILIQLLTGKLLKPYMVIFESMRNVVTKANEGDYTGRVKEIGSNESIEVAKLINILMEKFENILDEIEKKIDIFLSHKKVTKSIDPLEDVKSTISQLSDIYKFRRTIEHDLSIDDIYNRLITVFKVKLGIENFTIIECNTTQKSTKVIYSSKNVHCRVEVDGCRADRASVTVDSCQFKGICKSFKDEDSTQEQLYTCLPYSI
ncbi:MAG: GGDEF domain-containing protein, partial [Campylobacterota bacterium]|nr:GGDEF domain-containing protein [Campylobacterota bacterium]